MSMKELLIAIIFAFIIFVPFTNAEQSQNSSSASSHKATQSAIQENSNSTTTILIPIVSAILGGLVGAGISIYFSRRQAKQEYRSLILSFCSELVSAFRRCVIYYRQSIQREVSYSALFSFTDASVFSRFASVS